MSNMCETLSFEFFGNFGIRGKKKFSREIQGNLPVLAAGRHVCNPCVHFLTWKKKTELWSCVTQCCFHWRFNSLNSGAIGRALIHFTELGSSSAPFHGRRCGKHGTFSLLEINWWVIAPSEHMHTYLYLLPSELPIQLQQELNRLVCCFALLFLKAKLDKRLLGNRGCTTLLRNEQVQMSLRGFSRTCVFPPFCKMSCVKGSVVNNIVG